MYAKTSDSLSSLKRNRERTSEIGLMLPVYTGDNYDQSFLLFLGAQYKKWLHPNVGFRIIGGWGANNREQHNSMGSLSDTFKESKISNVIDVMVLGCGLEARKQFYKKVWFFAAVELKGAYGGGASHEEITAQYYDKYSHTSYTTYGPGRGYAHTHSLAVSLSPALGAELKFKRVVIGLELHALDLTYQHLTNAIGRSDYFDFNSISERAFINYRF